MPGDSAIGWTQKTWNPTTGCDKVSPGCAHCYAETFAERWRGIPGHPYEQGFDLKLWPERLDAPLRWRKPALIFVNSMSDLFHEGIPDEYIARVFGVMEAAPQHTFQILTKRPERMRDLLRSEAFIGRALSPFMGRALSDTRRCVPWPLSNVWLGVSIENRRFVGRADVLRETPAAVRFISAEPLLDRLVRPGDGVGCLCGWPLDACAPKFAKGGPCDRKAQEGPHLDLTGIDWLIVGGESGPKHRPIDPQWVRDLRDACLTACSCSTLTVEGGAEHVHRPAFYFKQWGGRTPTAGGRELDGRTWDEMPARRGDTAPAPLRLDV